MVTDAAMTAAHNSNGNGQATTMVSPWLEPADNSSTDVKGSDPSNPGNGGGNAGGGKVVLVVVAATATAVQMEELALVADREEAMAATAVKIAAAVTAEGNGRLRPQAVDGVTAIERRSVLQGASSLRVEAGGTDVSYLAQMLLCTRSMSDLNPPLP